MKPSICDFVGSLINHLISFIFSLISLLICRNSSPGHTRAKNADKFCLCKSRNATGATQLRKRGRVGFLRFLLETISDVIFPKDSNQGDRPGHKILLKFQVQGQVAIFIFKTRTEYFAA